MQLNNETGLVLVEKYREGNSDKPGPGPASWTTVSMSEIKVNDIFRFGGRRGRVFRAVGPASEGPILPGVQQVAVQEIVFELELR